MSTPSNRSEEARDDHKASNGSSVSHFSRNGASSRYAQTHQKREHRAKVTRRSFLALGGVVVLGIGAAAVGAASFVNSIGNRMSAGVSDETRAVLAAQEEKRRAQITENQVDLPADWTDTTPFYMLLIGTDKSESRTEGAEASLYGDSDSDYRSDVIILARIDPGNLIVTLVSIHRDTLVSIDGRDQKINAAYSLGGIPKTIEVVSDFAGVPISHYAEVDIDGLAAVVDTMGGVTVTVPYTIDDPMMGHLDAGTQTLNGQQALIFTRSRHAYDSLGDGDRYRAAHQRLFLAAMATQLFASSPTKILSVINTVADYITTDFTTSEIVSLALKMRTMDTTNDIYSTMNPTTPTLINGTWYELSDDEEWQELMRTVDAGEKPPVDSGYLDPLDDVNSASDGSNATTNNVAVNSASADSLNEM